MIGLHIGFQARLNVAKYAKRPNIAKALFEYIFYHENSVREAMDLAAQVNHYFKFLSNQSLK